MKSRGVLALLVWLIYFAALMFIAFVLVGAGHGIFVPLIATPAGALVVLASRAEQSDWARRIIAGIAVLVALVALSGIAIEVFKYHSRGILILPDLQPTLWIWIFGYLVSQIAVVRRAFSLLPNNRSQQPAR